MVKQSVCGQWRSYHDNILFATDALGSAGANKPLLFFCIVAAFSTTERHERNHPLRFKSRRLLACFVCFLCQKEPLCAVHRQEAGSSLLSSMYLVAVASYMSQNPACKY